jgi:hypothetical protein
MEESSGRAYPSLKDRVMRPPCPQREPPFLESPGFSRRVIDFTSHLVELFLASLPTRSAPANTIQSYSHDLMHVVQAVPADLASVSASAIQTVLDADGHHSRAPRERHYSTLCALNRWLLRQDLTPKDASPSERMSLPTAIIGM